MVAGEGVVGAAPFLGEGGPVDLCAFGSDCGSDGGGGRGGGGGVEGFKGMPLEIFDDGFAPIDDGAENLVRVQLRSGGEGGGGSGLTSKRSAFGRGLWLLVAMGDSSAVQKHA